MVLVQSKNKKNRLLSVCLFFFSPPKKQKPPIWLTHFYAAVTSACLWCFNWNVIAENKSKKHCQNMHLVEWSTHSVHSEPTRHVQRGHVWHWTHWFDCWFAIIRTFSYLSGFKGTTTTVNCIWFNLNGGTCWLVLATANM